MCILKLDLFVKRAASPQVVEAMRQTVTNLIGSLPPQLFVVTVTIECVVPSGTPTKNRASCSSNHIELLEAETEELNCQVGRKSTNGLMNELLEYMKSLEPQNLEVLESGALCLSDRGICCIDIFDLQEKVSAVYNANLVQQIIYKDYDDVNLQIQMIAKFFR